MKRFLAVVVLLAFIALSAFAQQPIVKANVPFEFMAAGKALPAGHYEFSSNDSITEMTVRNLDTGKAMVVHIVTKVSGTADKVRLTFDTVDNRKFLEAVWTPDGDGYLLATTKGNHTHEVVPAAEKK